MNNIKTDIALGNLFFVALSAFILALCIFLLGGNISSLFLIAFYAAILILIDYQRGVFLAVLLIPFAETQLIPRGMLGITGLNPFNVILVITTFSLFMAFMKGQLTYFTPIPFTLLLYVSLIVFGAVIGSYHVEHNHIVMFSATGAQERVIDISAYLLGILFKPLIILVVVWLVSVSILNIGSRIKEGEVYIWALALSCVIYFMVVIGYIQLFEIELSTLASSRSRNFLSWMGMHANELGLMVNMLFALMLYAALHSENKRIRTCYFTAASFAVITAAMTFSRSAFLGIIVVASYYLLSCHKFKQFLVGTVIVIVIAIYLPEAFLDRALTGFDTGDAWKVTAGRLDGIWLPLLPWALESPIIGHGLASTLWAAPRLEGGMLAVGHPHSAYLGVLLDFGLFGIVIIGMFFMSMWRLFRKLMQDHPDTFWKGVFEGGSVCMLVLLVQAVTDDLFVPSYNQVVLWIIYGIALAHQAKLAKGDIE